jgi:hypothetical protein
VGYHARVLVAGMSLPFGWAFLIDFYHCLMALDMPIGL